MTQPKQLDSSEILPSLLNPAQRTEHVQGLRRISLADEQLRTGVAMIGDLVASALVEEMIAKLSNARAQRWRGQTTADQLNARVDELQAELERDLEARRLELHAAVIATGITIPPVQR